MKRPSALVLLLGSVAAVALGGAAAPAQPLLAQTPPVQRPGGGSPALPGTPGAVTTTPITLEAGAGRLLQLPAPAATVMAADPRVARVQPASPTSLFVIGVANGRTTVLATSEDGTPVAEYAITVQGGPAANASAAAPAAAPAATPAAPPAAAVQAALRQILRGGGSISVRSTRSSLVLTGTVPTAAEAQRAEVIARGFLGEDQTILNELEVLSSVQVNLRVRVMEVSRDITRNLGFNWQALANTGDFVLGLRSGASAASVANAIAGGLSSSLTAPARLGVGIQSSRFDVNAVIDALAQDRLATILAEPNLTAQSGETASFLAGGEFPIPVAANALSNTVTIQFKQFGVALAFVPTVLGQDRLNLRVRPEVSELSDNGAISVPLSSGVVRIPALTVRRAETTVELGSGQSFAVAGLLQRSTSQSANGVAGLSEVPVLGALFKSDAFRRAETELVIIVTPYLVKPVSDPRALAGPTDGFRPATDLDRVLFNRQIARGAPAARPVTSVPRNAGFVLE